MLNVLLMATRKRFFIRLTVGTLQDGRINSRTDAAQTEAPRCRRMKLWTDGKTWRLIMSMCMVDRHRN